jgi:hypothetical protein
MRCVLPGRGPELALSLGIALCLGAAPPAGAVKGPMLPPIGMMVAMAGWSLEIGRDDGWSAFTAPKPAGKAVAPRPLPASPVIAAVLPPQRDALRLGVGLGAVAGADWGVEVMGSGAVRGFDTTLAASLTSGPLGTDLLSGHASLDDPESGWGGEAGDLASPLWGYARGFRLSRRRPSGAEWREPFGLSLYLANQRAAHDGTVLAYQGELPLGPLAAVGGEIASDGSWFGRARVRARAFGLYAYYRDSSGRYPGTSAGIAGFLDLPGGWYLQGGASCGGAGDRSVDLRNLSLRVPVGRTSLILESTGTGSRFSRNSLHSVTATLPWRSAYVLARYQRRDGKLRTVLGQSFRWWQDEALLSVSGLAGRRLRWDLQLTESWPWEGNPQTWGQLHLSWWLASSTSLHALAAEGTFPGSGVYSLRLEHQLRPDLLLSAEYGDVPTFQPGEPDGGDRLRLMVRKTWDVETPATGAVVAGRVQGSSGQSPGSVAVQLGPYRTVADAEGRYAFRNLPSGGYELRVLEESLPAGYAAPWAPRQLVVVRGERLDQDLTVPELGSAAGWVYVDRNSNSRRDSGEGLAGVVLRLDDRATLSGPDGAFGFYNVAPGEHRLWLDAGRLPDHLAATIPATIDLGLPPGRSLEGVELRLLERKKPVVFQELRQ